MTGSLIPTMGIKTFSSFRSSRLPPLKRQNIENWGIGGNCCVSAIPVIYRMQSGGKMGVTLSDYISVIVLSSELRCYCKTKCSVEFHFSTRNVLFSIKDSEEYPDICVRQREAKKRLNAKT